MKKIAYLGIPGSYSFIAANKYFLEKCMLFKSNSILNTIQKVSDNICDFGVVPLENSTTGSIAETYDTLIDSDLSIIGEIILHIHQHLLIRNEYKKKWIKKIVKCYSHQQAIAQCQNFFNKHYWIKPVFTADTATAARLIANEQNHINAAIGGREAAKLYDLRILKDKIEDNPTNYTRFAVISRTDNQLGNKISLVFSVEHKPGSLFYALEPYVRLGLNLTKIESRPVFAKPWEYIFLLDFEIGLNKSELIKLILEMKERVNFIKVLGRYNKGKIYET